MNPSNASPHPPIAPTAKPLGLIAPVSIQGEREQLADLSAIAATLLDDPLQVRRLVERVYQLLQADIQHQRERQGRYGGRR